MKEQMMKKVVQQQTMRKVVLQQTNEKSCPATLLSILPHYEWLEISDKFLYLLCISSKRLSALLRLAPSWNASGAFDKSFFDHWSNLELDPESWL